MHICLTVELVHHRDGNSLLGTKVGKNERDPFFLEIKTNCIC